jgi:hypothetical protein
MSTQNLLEELKTLRGSRFDAAMYEGRSAAFLEGCLEGERWLAPMRAEQERRDEAAREQGRKQAAEEVARIRARVDAERDLAARVDDAVELGSQRRARGKATGKVVRLDSAQAREQMIERNRTLAPLVASDDEGRPL